MLAPRTFYTDWLVVRLLLIFAAYFATLDAMKPYVRVYDEILHAEAERLGCYTAEEWAAAEARGGRCR